MTEQLTLEKSLGNGTCINTNHRLVLSATCCMNLTCKHILTRTILTRNEYRSIGRSNLIHDTMNILHSQRLPPIHTFPYLRLRFLRNLGHRFVCSLKRGNKFLIIPRLYDEIIGTTFHSLHSQCNISIGSKENNLHFRIHLFQLCCPVEAFITRIDIGIEVHVKQNHVRLHTIHCRNKSFRRGYNSDFRKMRGKQNLQGIANTLIIIYYQYLSFLHIERKDNNFLRNSQEKDPLNPP